MTATSSNGHIETLGYIVNQSQCNLQLCYVAVRREVSACHRYIHTYKGTYIYIFHGVVTMQIWYCSKYDIIPSNIANDSVSIVLRRTCQFTLRRIREFIRLINFQNPPTSLIGPLLRIVTRPICPEFCALKYFESRSTAQYYCK